MYKKNQVNCKNWLIILFLLIANSCFAQLTEQAKTDSIKSAADSLKQLALKVLAQKKIDSALKQQNPSDLSGYSQVINVSSYESKNTEAGIGDIIIIEVSHFKSLLHQKDSAHQKISLFIDGRKIDNIEPLSGAPEMADTSKEDHGTFQFSLERNMQNDKTWAGILGSPSLAHGDFFKKRARVSVGTDYPLEIFSNDFNFTLVRIHKVWFWSCTIIILIYLYVFFTMVKNGGLLRDRGIDLSALGIATDSKFNVYSLGRFQMAFWFTLTIISFFFIWLITDAYNIISTTVLALIGISAGTSLSAAAIDNSKSTGLLNETLDLENEAAKLAIEIPQLQNSISVAPASANVSDLQSQLNIKNARAIEIQSLIATNRATLIPKKSKGFIDDVLADANGISFHRLQMFVWTFVLGLIFIYSVWKSLSMPEFDATLLALQGITAGTYLGFKFPESQA